MHATSMTFPPTPALIDPNWHVALVHFPVALLAVGLLMELFGLLGRSPGVRLAGRWMLLLGAVSGAAAAVSGLYALQDVMRAGRLTPLAEWDGLPEEAWTLLRNHAVLQGVATVGALAVVGVYLALGDTLRRALYLPLLLAMVGVVALTLAGSHVAGRAAYEHAVGTQATLKRPAATLPPLGEVGVRGVAAAVAPPLELHGVLAGLALATGVLALACAWRNASAGESVAPADGERQIFPGTGRGDAPRHSGRLPAKRALLATTALAVAAATAGWWHLAQQVDSVKLAELWEVAVPFPLQDAFSEANREELRRPVHLLLGTVVAGVPVLLAGWTFLRPRGRVVLLGLGTLWLLAAALQVWMGILLLWDLPVGPLTGFNRVDLGSP